MKVQNLRSLYRSLAFEINEKLRSFRKIWADGDDKRIFEELVFCILTPQSKAEVCWKAVENLKAKGLIYKGSEEEIISELKGVRFKRRKAFYIILARDRLGYPENPKLKEIISLLKSPIEMRDWLAKNIKGIGYKEASHFLRNIGLGESLAILDRHVLRFMLDIGLIKEIPKSLSRGKYLKIENILKEFSREIDIPLAHLDFVLWYDKTGRIFK